MKRLMEAWLSLSFEKRLTIVVMPIILTVVGSMLSIVLPRLLGDSTSKAANQERLELVDLRPADAGESPGIEILIRNVGNQVSLVNAALLDVTQTWRFTSCAQSIDPLYRPAQKYKYFVDLSKHPERPIRVPLAQVVKAQEVDRFFIGLVPKVGAYNDAPALYRFRMKLVHDNARTFEAGEFALALPLPDADVFSRVHGLPPSAGERACLAGEKERFLDALADEGTSRSLDLDRLIVELHPLGTK